MQAFSRAGTDAGVDEVVDAHVDDWWFDKELVGTKSLGVVSPKLLSRIVLVSVLVLFGVVVGAELQRASYQAPKLIAPAKSLGVPRMSIPLYSFTLAST